MKKTNFFGAKTLVAVALTSLMFTSCEDESMVINPQKPTELPAASAVVNAITIDAATGMEINATYNVAMPYSVAADASGNIAATSVDLVASAEGYYDATKAVAVPAVAKGQMVYIPTTLYATAIEAEVSVENPTIDETIADKIKDVQAIDDFTAGKSNTITVNVPYGYRITNMEEVLADIEALTYADGRALTEESVMAVVKENLKKLAESMAEFKTKEHTIDIFIPDGTAKVNATVTAHVAEGVITLSTTQMGVDGAKKTWSVEAKVEEVQYNDILIEFIDEDGHSHAGHAGHGNSANAGGGEGGK